MKIAFCGCSWVSSVNRSHRDYDRMWQNIVAKELKATAMIYGKPGSTNTKIYTQVEQGLRDRCDIFLVFLTSPYRFNVTWEGKKWTIKNNFQDGMCEVVNRGSKSDYWDYIGKYYCEDMEVLNGHIITEAIYHKLLISEKKFLIFRNAFKEHVLKDSKVFKQDKIVRWGPYQLYSKKTPQYKSEEMVNHLSLEGNLVASNKLIGYINDNL